MFTLSLIVEYAGHNRRLRHYKQMEIAALAQPQVAPSKRIKPPIQWMAVSSSKAPSNPKAMNSPTREEFNAKLEAIERGKNTGAVQAEVKKQSEETAALIKKVREDLDARRAEATGKN